MDWILTVPKTISWSDYERELNTVENGSSVMNYRVRFLPKDMHLGDRCYVVWNGRVRGWMEIVGLLEKPDLWRCTTTGRIWPAGNYIQRSGPFHPVDGPEYPGFRGVRKYTAPESRVAVRWLG